MGYKVTINKKAIKTLEKISEPDYSKIKKTIFSLAINPRPAALDFESVREITELFMIFLIMF